MNPIKVGRLSLEWPGAWDAAGDDATLRVAFGDGDAGRALRLSVLGLAGVEPVTAADDDTVDGYYDILAAKASDFGGSIDHGTFDGEIVLHRVKDYASPRVEEAMVGATRGTFDDADAEQWHGVPSESLYYTDGKATAVTTRHADDGAGGTVDVDVYVWPGSAGDHKYNITPSYAVAPAHFYDGSPQIEMGDPLAVLVGRQCRNTPTDWRLSNGLVEVTPTEDGRLVVAAFDGADWTTGKGYIIRFADGVGSSWSNWRGTTILRNDASVCALRLTSSVTFTSGWGASPDLRVFVDLLLRRGSRMIEVTVNAATAQEFEVARSSSEPAVSLTGGLRADDPDDDGYWYVMATEDTVTDDTGSGAFHLTSAATLFRFGLGLAFTEHAFYPFTYENPQSLVNQYMAHQSTALRVVQ